VHDTVVLDVADQRRGHQIALLARNTPVPGTRCTPATSFANSLRGTASFPSAARSSSRPLRQVVNIRHSAAPASAESIPGGHFGQVAGDKRAVGHQHQAEKPATCHFGQFHCVAATNAPRIVVTTMVRHRGAVSAPQGIGGAEADHEGDDRGNTSQLTIGT